MLKLDTPPVHPERWPYVRIDHDLCGWIRVPTSGEVLDALAPAEDPALSAAAKVEVQLGATVALGWMSHQWALESTDPREVFKELHEAGQTLEQIASLAMLITDAYTASITTEAQVKEATDFTPDTQPSG